MYRYEHVTDLSRLGRNAIDSGYYIERHFPSLGVRYVAVTDDYDSADGQSGGIMLSLKNMINEAYALDASRKVKATIQMNIRKGNFVGGISPYGYFKSDGDCYKLVIDEYAATVVRVIFEMAANGKSHSAIREWLNSSGHLPPKRYFYSIGLATENEVGVNKIWWGVGAVKDTLKNRMYCGDMVQGKHTIINNINRKVPKHEWVIVTDAHEARSSTRKPLSLCRKSAKTNADPPKWAVLSHSPVLSTVPTAESPTKITGQNR